MLNRVEFWSTMLNSGRRSVPRKVTRRGRTLRSTPQAPDTGVDNTTNLTQGHPPREDSPKYSPSSRHRCRQHNQPDEVLQVVQASIFYRFPIFAYAIPCEQEEGVEESFFLKFAPHCVFCNGR